MSSVASISRRLQRTPPRAGISRHGGWDGPTLICFSLKLLYPERSPDPELRSLVFPGLGAAGQVQEAVCLKTAHVFRVSATLHRARLPAPLWVKRGGHHEGDFPDTGYPGTAIILKSVLPGKKKCLQKILK